MQDKKEEIKCSKYSEMQHNKNAQRWSFIKRKKERKKVRKKERNTKENKNEKSKKEKRKKKKEKFK